MRFPQKPPAGFPCPFNERFINLLTETGQVIAVDEDGLWVETLKKTTCSACAARHGCGQRLLASASQNMSLIKALFRQDESSGIWKVGDIVSIGMEETALLRAALYVYLGPLLCLLLFVLAGAGLGLPDGLLALLAVAGILIGGLIVRLHAQIMNKSRCDRSRYDRFSYHAVVLSKVRD